MKCDRHLVLKKCDDSSLQRVGVGGGAMSTLGHSFWFLICQQPNMGPLEFLSSMLASGTLARNIPKSCQASKTKKKCLQ